jgi:hypothetical protein
MNLTYIKSVAKGGAKCAHVPTSVPMNLVSQGTKRMSLFFMERSKFGAINRENVTF